MNSLATLGITALKKGVDYIKNDRNSFYALNTARWITIEGKGIGVGNFCCDGFCIISEKGGGQITLTTEPFDLTLEKWLGPLWFPDTMKDGSFEASLWVSLLLFHRARIIAALGIKPAKFDRWAQSIYIAAWKGYAAALYHGALANAQKQYFAFNAAQWEGWIKRTIKKVGTALAVVALCVTLGICSGCSSPDPYTMTGFGDGPVPVELYQPCDGCEWDGAPEDTPAHCDDDSCKLQ